MQYRRPSTRSFVAGHRGLVGSAIVRRLQAERNVEPVTRTRAELNLLDARAVDEFFRQEHLEEVYLAAAKVGGILANSTQPAEFARENLLIASNVIHSAWKHGVRKLLFLGSSCIYPRMAAQPITEDSLLSGPLEETNRAYAVAKIAGIELCRAYRAQYGFNAISVMPTNLYGPGDNFDMKSSHVLPALVRKFHEAKRSGAKVVDIWGTGTPRREFLHVDDLADACVYLMANYDEPEIVNIGVGEDISIRDLAELIRRVVDVDVELRFDSTKPDGTPRKLLDVSRLTARGWRASIALEQGIASTYQWYCEHAEEALTRSA